MDLKKSGEDDDGAEGSGANWDYMPRSVSIRLFFFKKKIHCHVLFQVHLLEERGPELGNGWPMHDNKLETRIFKFKEKRERFETERETIFLPNHVYFGFLGMQ